MVQYARTKKQEKVRRYRMLLFGILIVLITVVVWYCVHAAKQSKEPHNGTLVYHQIQMNEGIDAC